MKTYGRAEIAPVIVDNKQRWHWRYYSTDYYTDIGEKEVVTLFVAELSLRKEL